MSYGEPSGGGEQKVWPNSGRAFQNEDKRPDKQDADYRGDGEVTCPHCQRRVSFFVSLWKKTGGKGPWASFSFKPKDKQPDAGQAQPPAKPAPSFGPSQLDMPSAPGAAKRGGFGDSDVPF